MGVATLVIRMLGSLKRATNDSGAITIYNEYVEQIKIWKCGRVRFIAPVLKTDDPKGSVSSNLTASTRLSRDSEAVKHESHKLESQVRFLVPQPNMPL